MFCTSHSVTGNGSMGIKPTDFHNRAARTASFGFAANSVASFSTRRRVFVDGLEVSIMCNCPIRQGKPERIGNAFVGWPALDHLGSQEKLFHLVFGQGRFIRGGDNASG
jgi:hypothetical protein